MDSKIIIAIVAAVAIIAAAGAAIVLTKDNGEDVPSDGILYDGNGGKLSDGRTTYTSHSTNVDTCSFEKEGYHWIIWNTKADGSGDNYNENSVAPQKTRLYAQWSNLNTIFGDDDGIEYVSLYVAGKEGNDPVNIDKGYASLPTDAVLIAKPQTGVTLKIHVDGKSIIAETATKNVDMHYSSGNQGISFENGKIRAEDGAVVFEIRQTVSNQNAFLNYSSVQGFDVLDVGGTREIPSDIMSIAIGDGETPGISINHTGSVECGEEAVIVVTTPVSGQTVQYDGESQITVTLPSGKVHTLDIEFKNGGQLESVVVEDNVAIISFTYDDGEDPEFIRLYSHNRSDMNRGRSPLKTPSSDPTSE